MSKYSPSHAKNCQNEKNMIFHRDSSNPSICAWDETIAFYDIEKSRESSDRMLLEVPSF